MALSLGESALMASSFITAIVLAAGQGSRMRTSLPKSLHPVAGKPVLARILQALKASGVGEIRVVINEEQEHLMRPVAEAFKADVSFQENRKGTAAAVMSAQPTSSKGDILIVNGDHPLIQPKDLQEMIKVFHQEQADLCIGTFEKKNPGHYGRIIRKKDNIVAIAEKESLSHESEKINEINTGIYLFKNQPLNLFLSQIDNKNPKEEFCLTDIVALFATNNKKISGFTVSEQTAYGVNSQRELAFATKQIFTAKLNQLMQKGVIIIDTLNTYIEEDVRIGQGSVIYPGVYLKGKTAIGSFCAIEPHCFISDSLIHELVLVRAGCYLEAVEVKAQSVLGPYARLRSGTQIGQNCRVGNFVEMKKTQFGNRSKAGHFSYLGDAQVGEDVNIGCGTITSNLNLDGKKYSTTIKDKVFVGSGTQLVAPVELDEESATGAGSVITENVPARSLAVGRSRQNNLQNYFTKKKSDEKKPMS